MACRLQPAAEGISGAWIQADPNQCTGGFGEFNARTGVGPPKVAWIQDDIVPAPQYAVPVRLYHPIPDRRLPVLIFYHGGGHMAGSVTVYDPICRKLALAASHLVVAADYRLAPECSYPLAVIDACNVAKNVWQTLDSRKLKYRRQLSLAGDSGGGALCATVAHISQYDRGLQIKHQVLIYPSLDYTMGTPSIDQNAEGYLLHKEKICWYFDNFFQHGGSRQGGLPACL